MKRLRGPARGPVRSNGNRNLPFPDPMTSLKNIRKDILLLLFTVSRPNDLAELGQSAAGDHDFGSAKLTGGGVAALPNPLLLG